MNAILDIMRMITEHTNTTRSPLVSSWAINKITPYSCMVRLLILLLSFAIAIISRTIWINFQTVCCAIRFHLVFGSILLWLHFIEEHTGYFRLGIRIWILSLSLSHSVSEFDLMSKSNASQGSSSGLSLKVNKLPVVDCICRPYFLLCWISWYEMIS